MTSFIMSFIRFYSVKSYLINTSSVFDASPQNLSSNMSDKILVPDNRLVAISNYNDVTMTFLTLK